MNEGFMLTVCEFTFWHQRKEKILVILEHLTMMMNM